MVAHPSEAFPPATPPATVRVHVSSAGGQRLVADRIRGAGPAAAAQPAPVVFAHGFGQTRGAWTASATRVAQAGHDSWVFDGRGHGESDWNAEGQAYHLDQFVADARALAALPPRPPVWIGASMGGLLGLLAQGEAETQAPFSALVLVDITPRWETAGVERILGFMRAHPDGFPTLEAAADTIARYLPHRRRKSPQQLATLLVPDGAGGLRWHWDPRLLDEMAHEAERWQARLMAAARRLSVPTLLVSGGLSDLVSDATVDEFLGLVPHAAHVRIDDATHMVAGDRNDAFTDVILDFLAATAATRNGAAR